MTQAKNGKRRKIIKTGPKPSAEEVMENEVLVGMVQELRGLGIWKVEIRERMTRYPDFGTAGVGKKAKFSPHRQYI